MPKRHDNTGRSKGPGKHVRLYESLMKSAAWRSLTPAARSVYVELSRRYNGSNNGRISLSVREAATLCNIAKDTATRALRELIAKGFIECVTKGAFSMKVRHATEWRLTEHVCNVTDDLPKKTFMRWIPQNQNAVPVGAPDVPEAGPIGPKAFKEAA